MIFCNHSEALCNPEPHCQRLAFRKLGSEESQSSPCKQYFALFYRHLINMKCIVIARLLLVAFVIFPVDLQAKKAKVYEL